MKRLLPLFFVASARLVAATIAATGSWSTSLSSADLVSGAGSDLPSTLTSTSSAVLMDVTNSPIIGLYHVYARLSSTGVPSGVTISIKRTTDGSSFLNLGLISGGTSYQTLTTTDIEIFNGALDRSSIALQLQATGVSVHITPATYQPSVIFTVTP